MTEQDLGGASFVRVDVPEVDDHLPFTKLYGASAIYAITPTTKEIATHAAKHFTARPISVWDLPNPETKQIAAPVDDGNYDDDFDPDESEIDF